MALYLLGELQQSILIVVSTLEWYREITLDLAIEFQKTTLWNDSNKDRDQSTPNIVLGIYTQSQTPFNSEGIWKQA